MWDFDDQTKSCNPCIAPFDKEMIIPGADAAFAANDPVDADRTGTADALNSQKDADARFVDHVFCQEPRDYIVTLNVWDGNHLLHPTLPDASYVHIQTAGHTSVVHCQAVTVASIAATSGTPQSANINTAFSTPLQATVTDAAGKPVNGVQMMFTAPTSGPSGLFGGRSTTTVATDAQGHATATITANRMAEGPYGVVASAANVTGSAVFVLTNVLPGASQLVFVHQPTNTVAGQVINPPVTVRAQDSAGRPVSMAGIPIVLSLSSGTGTLLGTLVQVTDSTGLAVFTICTWPRLEPSVCAPPPTKRLPPTATRSRSRRGQPLASLPLVAHRNRPPYCNSFPPCCERR
jgi:hypothetical protein